MPCAKNIEFNSIYSKYKTNFFSETFFQMISCALCSFSTFRANDWFRPKPYIQRHRCIVSDLPFPIASTYNHLSLSFLHGPTWHRSRSGFFLYILGRNVYHLLRPMVFITGKRAPFSYLQWCTLIHFCQVSSINFNPSIIFCGRSNCHCAGVPLQHVRIHKKYNF